MYFVQDYHANAEKAKRELDGTVRKGRTLKIRFAPNGATVKVKNLTPWISNELLHAAFSVFGEVSLTWIYVCISVYFPFVIDRALRHNSG